MKSTSILFLVTTALECTTVLIVTHKALKNTLRRYSTLLARQTSVAAIVSATSMLNVGIVAVLWQQHVKDISILGMCSTAAILRVCSVLTSKMLLFNMLATLMHLGAVGCYLGAYDYLSDKSQFAATIAAMLVTYAAESADTACIALCSVVIREVHSHETTPLLLQSIHPQIFPATPQPPILQTHSESSARCLPLANAVLPPAATETKDTHGEQTRLKTALTAEAL